MFGTSWGRGVTCCDQQANDSALNVQPWPSCHPQPVTDSWKTVSLRQVTVSVSEDLDVGCEKMESPCQKAV
ncbi:hypothetical protein XELAEV_18026187mg [Xenopus laevis]|uniref:Uncharacterized protein n=1 Tax=Xenopus laevis TaxID=8355 RepID=A0A974CTE1_XENLA|nr:hypothetical protein XELAEV_18026187mg [Xenopus laevis]